MMKGVTYCIFLVSLLLSLLFSQPISARLLPTVSQSHEEDDSSVKIQEDDVMAKLLGMEECHENDEACLNRRMVAEAHLDYIYTQRQKPKGLP